MIEKKPSSSSRWVELNEILQCLKTKKTLLNKRNNKNYGNNVWIVHPENLQDFLNSIIFDEYKNQLDGAWSRLLSLCYEKYKSSNYQDKEITLCRQNVHKSLLTKFDKCQISSCEIVNKQCLVASHIFGVSEIYKLKINFNEKLNMIQDINNVILLCCIHDKLFDRHLISFNDNGILLVSKIIHNLEPYNLKLNFKYFDFNADMLIYIKKHRNKFYALERKR